MANEIPYSVVVDDKELQDALVGIYAYDQGDVSCGIRDEPLRARCVAELQARLGPHDIYPRVLVGRMVRELFLTEEALEQGYGPEDAHSFIEWLDNDMR